MRGERARTDALFAGACTVHGLAVGIQSPPGLFAHGHHSLASNGQIHPSWRPMHSCAYVCHFPQGHDTSGHCQARGVCGGLRLFNAPPGPLSHSFRVPLPHVCSHWLGLVPASGPARDPWPHTRFSIPVVGWPFRTCTGLGSQLAWLRTVAMPQPPPAQSQPTPDHGACCNIR